MLDGGYGMSDGEMAKNYALERQKNFHLSQRDTNLIQLAYLHGLKAKLKQLKQLKLFTEQGKWELLDIIQRKDELIQKMKCCGNCNGKFLSTRCKLCKDYSNWELASD